MKTLTYSSVAQLDKKRIWGRTVERAEAISLYWTGSGVELIVESSELWVEIEADYDVYESWMSTIINGEVVSRQMLQKGRYWICLYRNLNSAVPKHVRLIKDVQAMSGDSKHRLLIHGFKYDGVLKEVPTYERRIEFIGDSITSGEGAIGGKAELDWVSMWFSATDNYTRFTADALVAEYRVISQSGWGVYCSWDYNTSYNIPSYYEQICGLMYGEEHIKEGVQERHDFTDWQPHHVVINLGTNDASAYRILCSQLNITRDQLTTFILNFEKAIYEFLQLVRRHNPRSSIIWAYGMLGSELLDTIVQTIEQYKTETEDDQVYFCKLPNMDENTVGSRQHPGKILHIIAAKQLTEHIKKIERGFH